jgi:hypothetical protein
MATEKNSDREKEEEKKEKEQEIEVQASYTSNEACNPPKEPSGTSVRGKVIKINKKKKPFPSLE